MSKENALEKYARALQAVKDHTTENQRIFDIHKKFLFDLMDAENELRDAVAEEKAGVSNGAFTVTCDPQTQTTVDYEELRATASREGWSAEHRATIEKFIHVQERPPRIVISEKGAS